MKTKLNKIRKPKKPPKRGVILRNALLFLLLGVILGIFAKWLDELALDSRIWWHLIIEKLDLVNVFSGLPIWLTITLAISVFSGGPGRAALYSFLFLLGMCASYHAYTVLFAGFNPDRYMMIWYGITVLSPLLAVLCWYGKSAANAAIALDTLIMAVMAASCFSLGWVYIGLNGAINAFLFAISAVILCKKPKQIIISTLGGVALAVAVTPLLPFSL